MALIGAILVEIKLIEFLCERLLREGDRQALQPSIGDSQDIKEIISTQ